MFIKIQGKILDNLFELFICVNLFQIYIKKFYNFVRNFEQKFLENQGIF